MSTQQLEERLATLEQEMAQVKALLKPKDKLEKSHQPWWDTIAGSFADDPNFDEVVRLGREWRESSQD